MGARTNTGELQELRRIHRTAAQDHLASSPRLYHGAAALIFNTRGAAPLEQDAARLRVGFDPQVVSPPRRPQEGTRGGMADAPVSTHLRIADAFRLRAVQVLRERHAGG